jgi:hypothetical protein
MEEADLTAKKRFGSWQLVEESLDPALWRKGCRRRVKAKTVV